MVDTVRSLSALQTLLADNTAGDISAQDGRDVLVTSDYWQRKAMWRSPIAVPSADDILWAGSDAAGMTTVTVSGTQTITEADGMLSVAFQDQTAADTNCVLMAHTFSVGDAFIVPVSMWSRFIETSFNGLVFTDGTTGAANSVAANAYLTTVAPVGEIITIAGTLTNANAAAAAALPWDSRLSNGFLWMKLEYTSANNFTASYGPDGVSFPVVQTIAKTITPTHFGVYWSSWGGTTNDIRVTTYGPIHKVA